MKVNSLFLIGMLLLHAASSNAQSPEPKLNYSKLSRNDWSSILRGQQPLMTKRASDIELRGSPFIFDTYEKGAVIVSDSMQFQYDLKFKLNAEDDEIWIINDKEEELVLTDKRITGLNLNVGNKTYAFRKAALPEIKANPFRYSEVLYSGSNFSLVKNTSKKYEPANAVDKGVAVLGRKYDLYITNENYYLRIRQNAYQKVALKKSDLYKVDLSLYNSYRKEISDFCIKHHISAPLSETSAVELLQYLDELKASQ